MATYDKNVDYQDLINKAVANGDYASAAAYEQQRNAKIADMNAASTNTNNYKQTNLYSNSGAGNISTAQAVAQATSPATAATGQTRQTSYQSGAINSNGTTTVSNKGQGELSYDNSSGRLVRTMPNGSAWYVDPTDAKYAELYQEYYNRYGNDPRGLYTGSAAAGAGMMQSAATSNDAYIQEILRLSNALANAQAPAYQTPDNSAQKAMLDQYLAQLGSIEYNPVDYDQYMSRAGTLDEYYQQAMDVLNPRYQSQYRDVYNKSANNLGKAGIFNSLAAQALMAQQQNAVTEALNADAAEMGQNLYQKALDRAYQAYQAAVQENQFGASFKQQNLTESGKLTMNYIDLLNDEAAAVNDYNMQAYLAKMQQYTGAIDAAYKAGNLTSAEYENMMNAAKIELSKVEQQLTQAQIANTEADTDYTKAKTQAVLWEMSNPTSASGYGYGYGSGGSGYGSGYGDGGDGKDVDIDNTPAGELYDYYVASNGNKSQYLAMAQAAGYDKKNADYFYVNTDKMTQLNNTAYNAQNKTTPEKTTSNNSKTLKDLLTPKKEGKYSQTGAR